MEVITLVKEVACAQCREIIPAGAQAKYYSPTKVYHHPICPRGEKSPKGSSYQGQLLEELRNIRHAIIDMARAIREKGG